MELANKFNFGIQYLRGIAAISVVLCHYSMTLSQHQSLKNLFNYGQLGVQVFFFISGYVILLSMQKLNYRTTLFPKFIFRRSIRIDIVYITVIILTLITFSLLNRFSLFNGKVIPFNIFQFLAHIFYYVPFTKYEYYNHVFWTLSIEFQFYILIGLLYFLNKSEYYKASFLCIFGLSCFLNFTNDYYLINTYALYFSIGMATFQYQFGQNKIFLLLIVLFLGMIIYLSGWLLGLLIVLSILVVLYTHKKNVYLNYLGKISYSLYLTHPLILVYSHGIIKRLWPSLLHFEIWMLLLHVIVAIAAASIFFLIVERPSIKLSKKINFSA